MTADRSSTFCSVGLFRCLSSELTYVREETSLKASCGIRVSTRAVCNAVPKLLLIGAFESFTPRLSPDEPYKATIYRIHFLTRLPLCFLLSIKHGCLSQFLDQA